MTLLVYSQALSAFVAMHWILGLSFMWYCIVYYIHTLYLVLCPKTWQVTSAAVHRPGRADSGSSLASPNARPSPRPSTGFPGTRTATADGRLAGCDAGDCLAGPG